MKKNPRISQAEWEVMKVVWDRAPLTANEIVDELAGRNGWHHRTVRTMLNRLVKKGALRFRAEGKRYIYRPNIAKADCVTQEAQGFLDRVFGGSAAPMLVHFVKNAELSAEEIGELQRILEGRKEGS
ncbi:MAG: BlaI/MecI/CopY family transcriptional regulator [Kiritimatiellae bacterium]|nr:BlaI/MecI/CopY family transcriptional regulator [Kiritimatiellia bacterium]